jgi:hypothetical protein
VRAAQATEVRRRQLRERRVALVRVICMYRAHVGRSGGAPKWQTGECCSHCVGCLLSCGCMQADGNRQIASLLECSHAQDRVQEVAGFAVHPAFRGVGRGDSLLDWIEQDARYRRHDLLVLLTTRTADWFQVRRRKCDKHLSDFGS